MTITKLIVKCISLIVDAKNLLSQMEEVLAEFEKIDWLTRQQIDALLEKKEEKEKSKKED